MKLPLLGSTLGQWVREVEHGNSKYAYIIALSTWNEVSVARNPMMAPCYRGSDYHTLICALALLSSPSVVCRLQSGPRGMRDFSLSKHRRRCARLRRGGRNTVSDAQSHVHHTTFEPKRCDLDSGIFICCTILFPCTQSTPNYIVFPVCDEKCDMQGIQECWFVCLCVLLVAYAARLLCSCVWIRLDPDVKTAEVSHILCFRCTEASGPVGLNACRKVAKDTDYPFK